MVDFADQQPRATMRRQKSSSPHHAVRLAVAAGLAVAAALTAAVPATGVEVEGFALSDATPKHHEEFGPIAGNDPSAQALTPTLANCRDLPGNVLVPIEMKFKKDFGHILDIVITWTAPEVNDIDIYFFDEGGEVVADSATSDQPEKVKLGSLANGQYYLCVRSFSGPNAGFVLDASVRFLTLFTRPPTPPTDAPAPTRTSAQTTPQPGAGALKTSPPTAEAVSTPGPDGPFSDQGLINVAGSRQAARDEGGRSVTEIVFIALTGLIAAGGAALVVIRIRRDTT
jgi:hypothetical protein